MKIFYAFLLLCLPHLLWAQDETAPELTASFFAIIVEDMDTSLLWYKEKLGFRILTETNLPDRALRQANLQKDHVHLELIELASALKPAEAIADFSPKSKITGFFKVGFRVPDFESWLTHLDKVKIDWQGKVVKDPLSRKRMLIITDPDGNRLQFFES
ncbi:MAG: VOC family protein [Bacteroidota bacterium]